jgi:hypothetical protein
MPCPIRVGPSWLWVGVPLALAVTPDGLVWLCRIVRVCLACI